MHVNCPSLSMSDYTMLKQIVEFRLLPTLDLRVRERSGTFGSTRVA